MDIIRKDHQVRCPIRTEAELSPAVLEVDEKLKADPNNPDLWMERGLALAGQKLMREAVEAYSKAISLDPFKGIYYRHRAHRHLSCWEFREACADFVVASRLIPKNWDVWYHLGLSHYLLGEYEEAAEAYKRCLEVNDNDGHMIALCNWYWHTLMRLGRPEEAEKVMENITEGMDYIPDEISYYYCCKIHKGWLNPDDFIERALNFAEDHCVMAYSLSNHYRMKGDVQKADELLSRMMESEDPTIWAYFGYLAAVAETKMR